jgi:hypothetical protein
LNDSTQIPPADQRKTLRAPLIVLQVKMDDAGKSFFGYARNISRSGMFIPVTVPREPGSRFLVEIHLPAPINRDIRCTCEVVWKRTFSAKSQESPGMGLKFIDMPEEVAVAIDNWIKTQNQPEKAIPR